MFQPLTWFWYKDITLLLLEMKQTQILGSKNTHWPTYIHCTSVLQPVLFSECAKSSFIGVRNICSVRTCWHEGSIPDWYLSLRQVNRNWPKPQNVLLDLKKKLILTIKSKHFANFSRIIGTFSILAVYFQWRVYY